MNTMKQLLCLTILLSLACLWPQGAWAQTGPKETVEAANARLHKLVSQPAAEGSAAATRRDEQLRQIVTSLLDLDYMAEKALGRRWAERTAEERTQYLTLMRQLVERSYLRQARSRADYQIRFGQVQLSRQGQEAEVESTLHVTKQGRREEVEVIYSLRRTNGQWRVVDVETDGASTVRNYRAQFGRIIKGQGFPELLNRMRRRLAEGATDL